MTRTVVVAGYLVRYPLGGHVLSILHWLVGLRRLGFEVVFLEHHGWDRACYDPQQDQMTDDPSYGIAHVRRELARVGIGRWCYVDATGVYHGMDRSEVLAACRQAEAVVSLWCATWLEELRECRQRIFIDTDPGFTQFGMTATGPPSCPGYASPHDFLLHFTYGARIGQPDCPIPTHGIEWRPLRPPVALELLPPRYTPDARYFSTVMSWSSRPPIVYQGQVYGQKDVEFYPLIGLPSSPTGPVFEIALAGAAPRERILAEGWRLVSSGDVTVDTVRYREYIARSRGEFSVAVNLEVKSRSGWFSDRTAAYLATGKPAIVQDTGFSELLPTGEGLLAFRTLDDVVAAVRAIEADYPGHCEAARRLAERYFDSDAVIGEVLRTAGVAPAPA